MADAMDSKSIMGDHVWVQVPPSAPNFSILSKILSFLENTIKCFFCAKKCL